jgi:hypothetical protein
MVELPEESLGESIWIEDVDVRKTLDDVIRGEFEEIFEPLDWNFGRRWEG